MSPDPSDPELEALQTKGLSAGRHSIGLTQVIRWVMRNFLGGICMAGQFAVLCLIRGMFTFDYLAAAAIALQAAVIHNFARHGPGR
jgi:hypothetical protein